MLHIKRIYEPPAKTDGTRVLVDRLWPRGISKQKAALDYWLKEVAPSPELRVWFGHKPERFTAFRKKYLAELTKNPTVQELKDLAKNNPTLTLLYGAKDSLHNHATVLRDFLQRS